MPGKIPSDLPIHSFSTAQELEAFLEREHTTAPGFYLKLAKKASGIPSVSASQAVESALCFGWIDGRANAIDNDWWLVRFTPRRAKSVWSQKNANTTSQLQETGGIRPAGLAAVDAAKADGRWERAYAGPATMIIPTVFQAALDTAPAAGSFFETLNKTNRYSVLWRIQTTSPAAREKRIEALVQMLTDKKLPTSLNGKRKKEADDSDIRQKAKKNFKTRT
ncbi:hypothetical protein N7520_003115 [Penicillium odoratum]|uniref:uncharacterized protein n=1 Tax=Penicillium odoratum TaxID=1167516 RepID=UPI002548F445|nr:uncharacterized protein N7520_003115 [Penicillium odoratum]KAJ5772586.1 hypothetical protein N7520_003115 [Penicillium odoratum]